MAAETPDTPHVPFTIDGVEYEYPDFTDLTLDEWNLVCDISGVTINDYAPEPDVDRERERMNKINNPNLLKAFVVVGYLREHPDASLDEAQGKAGRVKMIPLLRAITGEEEAVEVDPPISGAPNGEPATKPASERRNDSPSESSSPGSPSSSETPDDELATTGTTG